MSKRTSKIIELELRLIDVDAKDGRYQIVADSAVFALVKFVDGQFVYPGGHALDFVPTHYRPAGGLIKPEDSDG